MRLLNMGDRGPKSFPDISWMLSKLRPWGAAGEAAGPSPGCQLNFGQTVQAFTQIEIAL